MGAQQGVMASAEPVAWACAACTFINDAGGVQCEVCGGPRQSTEFDDDCSLDKSSARWLASARSPQLQPTAGAEPNDACAAVELVSPCITFDGQQPEVTAECAGKHPI